jgi:Methyltransferase domain
MDFLDKLKSDAFTGLDVPADYVPDMHGWVNYGFHDALAYITERLAAKKRSTNFIEVGSWKGASSNLIAKAFKDHNVQCKNVVCVDTWLGSPEHIIHTLVHGGDGFLFERLHGYPQLYYTFVKNAKHHGNHDVITPLPMPSIQAAEVLAYCGVRADAVYIDAAHEYEPVLADIEAYDKLLTDDGILWGDDFHETWPGVCRAVREYAERKGLTLVLKGCNWLLLKPGQG